MADVRDLDLYVSGRLRAGERVLWVGTEQETRAALDRVAQITPAAVTRRSPQRRSLTIPGAGRVDFVHSQQAMSGRVADRVIITGAKSDAGRDGFGCASVMEAAHAVTAATTHAAPIIDPG